METDRIGEIAKRVAEHCDKARESIKRATSFGGGGLPAVQWLTADLQSQIARDAALLCAEEIISLAKSEVRGVSESGSNSGSSFQGENKGAAPDARILDSSNAEGARFYPGQPEGGS